MFSFKKKLIGVFWSLNMQDVKNLMENILTFILGISLIILSVLWYNYERKKIMAERKNNDYIKMSYTIEFIFGTIVLLFIGIKLVYNSFA